MQDRKDNNNTVGLYYDNKVVYNHMNRKRFITSFLI